MNLVNLERQKETNKQRKKQRKKERNEEAKKDTAPRNKISNCCFVIILFVFSTVFSVQPVGVGTTTVFPFLTPSFFDSIKLVYISTVLLLIFVYFLLQYKLTYFAQWKFVIFQKLQSFCAFEILKVSDLRQKERKI